MKLSPAQVQSATASLQRAEADLEQLKAKLQQADRDWRRAQKLGPPKRWHSPATMPTSPPMNRRG